MMIAVIWTGRLGWKYALDMQAVLYLDDVVCVWPSLRK